MQFLLSLTASQWFFLAFLLQLLSALLCWKVSQPDTLPPLRRRLVFLFSLTAAFALTIGLVRWGQQLEAESKAYAEAQRYNPVNYGH